MPRSGHKGRSAAALWFVAFLAAAPASAEPGVRLRFVKQWGDAPLVLDGAVNDVGFAGNTHVAYAVSSDSGSIRVFDAAQQKTRLYLPQSEPLPPRPRAALTPDGRLLAATVNGPRDTEVVLFDTTSGAVVQRLSAPGAGPNWEAMAVSRDGKTLLAAHESVGVFAWKLPSGERLWQQPRSNGGGRITKISWLPTHRAAVLFEVASLQPSPSLIDARSGALIQRYPGRRWKGEVSFDGQSLLGLNGENIDTWSVEKDSAPRSVPSGESGWVLGAAFSADGSRVFASGPSKAIREIQLASGRVTRLFQGHAASIDTLATSRDGRYLLSGSDDHTARVWDLTQSRELPRRFAHLGAVLSLAATADGSTLLSAGADGEVRSYAADGSPRSVVRPALPILDGGSVRAAALQLSGSRLVVADDGAVTCRDIDTGRLLWQKPLALSDNTVLDVNERHQVLVATGMTGFIFDARDGAQVVRFERGRVRSARFVPGTDRILWSDPTHALELIDTESGRTVTRLAGHRGPAEMLDARKVKRLVKNATLAATDLAIDPSARVLATVTDNQVSLWSLPGGNLIKSFKGNHQGAAALAFSPDSRFLVVGTEPGELTVIDVVRATEIATLALRTTPARNQEFGIAALRFLPGSHRLLLGTRGGSLYELELTRE